jgi:hypothetical protein
MAHFQMSLYPDVKIVRQDYYANATPVVPLAMCQLTLRNSASSLELPMKLLRLSAFVDTARLSVPAPWYQPARYAAGWQSL